MIFNLQSRGRAISALSEAGALFTLPLAQVLNNTSTALSVRCDSLPNPSSAAGILFLKPREDKKYHISISFDPFTLSVTLRHLYKSPFHCCKEDDRESSRWGLQQTHREGPQGRKAEGHGLSVPYLATRPACDSHPVQRQTLCNKTHSK